MNNVDITKNTYKEIYKSYTDNNSTLNDIVKQKLDKFIELLPSEKMVLDIGCANGRESKYLYDHGCSVTGIDILEEFTKIAKKTCPECEFLTCDMRNLPFKETSFNGIWASASFLHIPKEDALNTLKSMNTILKHKGILYLSVMQGDFNSTRKNEKMNWGERHFSDYQQTELEKLLEEAKYEVVDKDYAETSWGPVFLHYFCIKL